MKVEFVKFNTIPTTSETCTTFPTSRHRPPSEGFLGSPATPTPGNTAKAVESPKKGFGRVVFEKTVPQYSHRERDDSYRGVLFGVHKQPRWRIVVCRDGLQWILQYKDAPNRWVGKRYFARKADLAKAIERLFGSETFKEMRNRIEGLSP